MRPNTWLYLIGGLLLTFLALRFVLPYVLPFVLAGFFAVLIDPLVGWLERKVRLGRGLAVAAVLIVILAALVLGLVAGVSRLATEAADLVVDLPEYYARAEAFTEAWLARLGELSANLPDPVRGALEGQVTAMYGGLGRIARTLLDSVAGLPRTLMFTFVAGLATFFISRDKREINRFFISLLPAAWRARALAAQREVLSSFLGYIRAQLVLVLLTTTGSIIGLGLIGAPYALLIGITAGLLDLFPMVGPATLFIPWGLYHLLFANAGFGLRILIVLATVTALRQLVEARVIGSRIGLHPLATLVALYMGLAIFGARGLLIGPLTAIVLKAMAQSGLWPGYPSGGAAVTAPPPVRRTAGPTGPAR